MGRVLSSVCSRSALPRICARDMGVGAARHKLEWSNEIYPLFDSYIPLKPQGLAVTVPFAVKAAVKRTIKSNPRLWALAQTVRRTIKGGYA